MGFVKIDLFKWIIIKPCYPLLVQRIFLKFKCRSLYCFLLHRLLSGGDCFCITKHFLEELFDSLTTLYYPQICKVLFSTSSVKSQDSILHFHSKKDKICLEKDWSITNNPFSCIIIKLSLPCSRSFNKRLCKIPHPN